MRSGTVCTLHVPPMLILQAIVTHINSHRLASFSFTSCLCHGKIVRVTCRYAKFKDRFLRVVFASESLTSINYLDLSDAICDRIRHLLANGLTVGTYPFVFLAFSNSQLREHSCWLYCEAGRQSDGAPSADEIRQSIGELHALRTPAKFAARLGQGFSTTFETFRFDRGSVCVLPDVKARDGKLFSDGVGVITSEGMKKVVDLLPVRMRRSLTGTLPSAIQIRLGGCKGMLALWDNIRCAARLHECGAPVSGYSCSHAQMCHMANAYVQE